MGPEPDSSMSSSSLKITKLPKLRDDGANWGTYKDLVMNVLVAKGLRRHVVGTARAPPELTERDGEFFLPNRIAPLQKQAQVRQIIYETVSEATIFENKGEMVQMDTLTRLQTMRCLADDVVVKHITEMQRLKEAPDSMGAPITDHAFSAYVKASLPDKFRPLLSTIAATSRLTGRTLSSDMLIQEIYETADESTVQANVDAATEQTAMAASSGKGKGRGAREGKKDVKCDNCDRPGHTKRDCWSKGGGKEGQSPWKKGKKKEKASDSANSAAKDDSDSDYNVAASSIITGDIDDEP
ncbi:hypothetical protein K438DRAFT_533035 [Mycena galopus ATCC 62051]|nr:hypothetical protein K438DRAFT_533035 [Mycena galopus ATCC 62051]